MPVKIGDGAVINNRPSRIVDIINHYCNRQYGQFTRAMYRGQGVTGNNCLWFPQCSTKALGTKDNFKRTLGADNWLSADKIELFERAHTPAYDNALNKYNGLIRITFANVLPNDGYAFIGVFEYSGRKNGYRVYKRIANVTNTTKW